MLKLKNLFENYDLAKECLKLYDYSEKNLDRMLSCFRISSNAIYPFYAAPGKVCVLRLSPVEEKSACEVSSEIRFIEYLRENGVNAMKPYPMKDGRLSAVAETAWGAYNVSCFEKVAGETLEDAKGSLTLAFGYGKTLGQLHNAAAGYPYAQERRSWRELLEEVRQRLTRYHAPEGILRFCEETAAELEELPEEKETFGLVHYDFEPDNVLYDEETDAFGIIDFDDAIRCWYALDAVRAIDAMDDVVQEDMTEQAVAAFLAGYRSVRTFSRQQEDALPLMRRLVALQEYATILYVLSDAPREEPDWMVTVRKKLHGTLERIEKTYGGQPV